MKKVLIATIGDPQYTYSRDSKGQDLLAASYQQTNYRYDEQEFKSAYTFDALNSLLGIDCIILMGTAKSHWYALYQYMFQADNGFSALAEGKSFDVRYYEQLKNLSARDDAYNLTIQNITEILRPLRESLSNCLDIIILQPGRNDEEWEKNLHALRHLDDILPDESGLYIDITCGFRTLPLYEFLSILYIRQISGKNIAIRLLTYAFFNKDNSTVTPFVSLNVMDETLSYIQVVNEYKQFGTIHSKELIEDDVRDELTRNARQIINALSDHISFNNIDGFKTSIRGIHECLADTSGKDTSLRMRLLRDYVFADLDRRFFNILDNDCLLQYELAIWHFERKRYVVAAATAVECTISFAAGLLGEPDCEYDMREKISGALAFSKSTMNSHAVRKLKKTFNEIRLIRNTLVHPKAKYQSNSILSDKLKEYLGMIRQIYQDLFLGNEDNLNQLTICLRNDLSAR